MWVRCGWKRVKLAAVGLKVNARGRSDVDKTVFPETAETLQEGEIDGPELAVCANAEVICPRYKFRLKIKFVSARVIICKGWPAQTLRRIADIEPDPVVLRQQS